MVLGGHGAHQPMRDGGLLKGITATHRNLCVGTRVGIGGSPSNTNRGVQPTCIELCGCCGLLLSPTSDAWWWSLQGDRNRASDRGGVTGQIQVGGSPYNTNRGVQPTCVREADARCGLLVCMRLTACSGSRLLLLVCARGSVGRVCWL